MYLNKTIRNLLATLGSGLVGFGYLEGVYKDLEELQET
jgi:hypothetical protein